VGIGAMFALIGGIGAIFVLIFGPIRIAFRWIHVNLLWALVGLLIGVGAVCLIIFLAGISMFYSQCFY
jgi:hypothetical protein